MRTCGAAFVPAAALALIGLIFAAGPSFANDWGGRYGGPGYYWGRPVYGGPVFWQFYQPYASPERGQSPLQQAKDWQTCEQWATEQAFASGVPLGAARLSPDFRQALVACLANRGYRVGFGVSH